MAFDPCSISTKDSELLYSLKMALHIVHCLFVVFTINTLTSYNPHIGNATNDKVNTSEVGVITATTRMTTMACLRYLRMKSAERNPNFANNHDRIGISKTNPIANDMVISVEM